MLLNTVRANVVHVVIVLAVMVYAVKVIVVMVNADMINTVVDIVAMVNTVIISVHCFIWKGRNSHKALSRFYSTQQ